jgi:hypothetical protein
MFRMPYERVILGPRYALRLEDLQATDGPGNDLRARRRRTSRQKITLERPDLMMDTIPTGTKPRCHG